MLKSYRLAAGCYKLTLALASAVVALADKAILRHEQLAKAIADPVTS